MFDLTLTLRGSEPRLWRRLLAPGDATLEDLHEAIQSVTGWYDYHLHEFVAGGRRFGRPDYLDDWMEDFGPPLEDARFVRLGDLWSDGHQTLDYTYDFGDSWNWQIEIRREIEDGKESERFHCVDGAGAPPPEDCGGIGGFEELCEILADPDHPDHQDMLRWAPPGFDPESFQVAGTDWVLAHRDEGSERDHLLGWMGGMPEHLTVTAPYYLELWWRLQKADADSPERVDEIAEAFIDEFSRRPMPDRAGLTFGQFGDLTWSLTGHPRDPVELNPDLDEQELDSIPILLPARTMLQMFQEQGPQRAGVRRRLPERFGYIFLGRVAAQVEGREKPPISVRKWISRNSPDPAGIREMLQDTGLIRLYKKAFRLTRRGERLLEPARRGELLALLFRAFYRPDPEFDYRDHWFTGLAFSQGYVLFRWSRLDARWREPGHLLEEIVPSYAAGLLLRQSGREEAPRNFEHMILWPLERFGLAESGSRPGPGSESSPLRYRPTPLAGKFLQFRDLP